MGKFASHKWWMITAVLAIPLLAVAADVPNIFKPGDVIMSGQVNANFKNLSDRVTTLEAAAAAPPPNPWIKAGDNTTKAAWDALIAKFPPAQYEWGVAYNAAVEGTVHRVTFSS